MPRPKPATEQSAPAPPATAPAPAVPDTSKAPAPAAADRSESADADPCYDELNSLGITYSREIAPETDEVCRVASPVRLTSITTPNGSIELPGRPLLRCGFAKIFAQWAGDIAAPLSLGISGQELVAITTGPGFQCRERRGDTTAKISEHAFGNAIDIASLVLANKDQVQISEISDKASPHLRLLGALRIAACGYFTTVLGPGSNSAHESHLHFDLGLHGKTTNYRICE